MAQAAQNPGEMKAHCDETALSFPESWFEIPSGLKHWRTKGEKYDPECCGQSRGTTKTVKLHLIVPLAVYLTGGQVAECELS